MGMKYSTSVFTPPPQNQRNHSDSGGGEEETRNPDMMQLVNGQNRQPAKQ